MYIRRKQLSWFPPVNVFLKNFTVHNPISLNFFKVMAMKNCHKDVHCTQRRCRKMGNLTHSVFFYLWREILSLTSTVTGKLTLSLCFFSLIYGFTCRIVSAWTSEPFYLNLQARITDRGVNVIGNFSFYSIPSLQLKEKCAVTV